MTKDRFSAIALNVALLVIACSVSFVLVIAAINHWISLRSMHVVFGDIATNLRIVIADGKPTLPEAAQRFLGELTVVSRGVQDTASVSFLYTLTMFAVIAVSGALYRRALKAQEMAESALQGYDQRLAAATEIQVFVGQLTLAQALANDLGRDDAESYKRCAPVMRDTLGDLELALEVQAFRAELKSLDGAFYNRAFVGSMKRVVGVLRTVLRCNRHDDFSDVLHRAERILAQLRSTDVRPAVR